MTATSPTGMPTAPDAPAGGPSLPQRRRLVTEVPGPKSRALMARKRAAVADGLGAPLHLLPDAGHTPHAQRPEAVADLVEGFVADLGAR